MAEKYIRSGRSLHRNSSLREVNWSSSVGILSSKASKSIVTPSKNTILHLSVYQQRQIGWLRWEVHVDMIQWLSIRVESERILVRAWEFLNILQWGKCSEASTKTIVGEEWKITMLTESRSWFPSRKFVYAHGLCPVQRKNHRKNSWMVE